MRRIQFLTVLLTITAATAIAQGDDPPSRVGRLNYINGSVSFRPGSVDDWTAATLNYPLTVGDHLWTDDDSQTELHVGSTAMRMAPRTAMSFLNLDDRIVQISLTEGALNVHIRYLGQDESFEIDTPNASVSLLRPGDYRINADGDNAVTMVDVRGGEAEVTMNGGVFPVRTGQSARVAGIDNPSQDLSSVPPPDRFDRWCEDRERREAATVSARYVPREMVGVEDLDEYGVWTEAPQYGWIWRPRTVVVGWAPYHYGHWAWVSPWGWTWIDDAPWGFAPFHYGRWAFVAGGWAWVPGRMQVGVAYVRPVYAPALVAFVGGPRFGVSIGFGGGGGVAAWFPLGPGEVYRPAYHVSAGYVERVNITHVTNVTVINNVNVTNVRYVNQTVNGAVTVVPQQTFASARPVHMAALRVPPGAMAQAQVTGTTAVVVPEHRAVLGSAAAPPMHAPPPRAFGREVVARTPPPPPPVPFAAQQQALQANGGRPLAPQQMNEIRSSAPVRGPMVRTVAPGGMNDRRPAPSMAPRPQQPSIYQQQPVPSQQQPQQAPRPMDRPQPAPRSDQPQIFRPPQNDRPVTPRPVAPPDRPVVNEQRPVNPPPADRPRFEPRPGPQQQPTAPPERPRFESRPAPLPQQQAPPPPPQRPAVTEQHPVAPERQVERRPERQDDRPKAAERKVEKKEEKKDK